MTNKPPLKITQSPLKAQKKLGKHHHAESQLVIVKSGRLVLEADSILRVLSPGQAVWLPSYMSHDGETVQEGQLLSVYMNESATDQRAFEFVDVSPLLKALIYRRLEHPDAGSDSLTMKHIDAVILDELQHARPQPFSVNLPQDSRLQKIVHVLVHDPSDQTALATWSKQVGASERTLQRLFEMETGYSFRDWRTLLRFDHAKMSLLSGKSVTQTALEVGYESVSAFSAAFRSWFDQSPSDWLKSQAHVE